jgi:hypothetical protein
VFKALDDPAIHLDRLLLNVSIGGRLRVLLDLATSVALLASAAGVLGQAASREGTQSAHEDQFATVSASHRHGLFRKLLTF